MNIFLHVGAGKTGSSAIQSVLQKNRKKLIELGFLYPNFDQQHKVSASLNHAAFIKRNSEQDKTEKLQQKIQFCAKKGISNIVLSWEVPHVKKWDFIQSFTKEHTVKVICYFRRQDHWLESSWKQWGIKRYNTIDDYIENNGLGYAYCYWDKYCDAWSALVGKDNFISRVYEKEQLINSDVVSDFLNVIGCKTNGLDLQNKDDYKTNNFGFNRDVQEIISLSKHLFSSMNDIDFFKFLNDSLGESAQKLPFQEYNIFTNKKRLEILERYEKSNKRVALEYLGRKDERLFYEKLPDSQENTTSYEGLTIEKLVPLLMSIFTQQNERIQRLEKRIKELQKENYTESI